MSRLRLPTLVCAVVIAAQSAIIVATQSAVAEPTGQGILNAVAFQPLPADVPIEVRVLDNSNENLAIKAQLEAALAARGFTLAGPATGDAALRLDVDTGDSTGAWQSPSSSDRIRVMDDRGRLFPQGELDVTRQLQLPLRGTTVVTPAQFRLGLTLDQLAGGVRLWQGWAIADLSQGEPSELAAAMVPKLAGSLGQTVRQEAFVLQ